MSSFFSSEGFFTQICDQQPEAIAWLTPIYNDNPTNELGIVDFTIDYCNRAFTVVEGQANRDVAGRRILANNFQGFLLNTELFNQCVHVWETGTPFQYTGFNVEKHTYYFLSFAVVNNGILLTARMVDDACLTEHEPAGQNVRELDSIFQNSLQAIYLGEAIRDQEGRVVDLRFLRVNQKFLSMFDFTEQQLLQNSLITISPETASTPFLAILASVLETGKCSQETLYYPTKNQWYEFSMVRIDSNKVSVFFANISSQKQNAAMLHNILQYSAAGISYGEVIRNKEGNIVDGRPILANEAALQLSGISRELFFSKTSVELEPNILNTPYFKKIVHTMETGEPSTARYQVETSGKWIELTISRMDSNHMIIVFNDISAAVEAQHLQQRLLDELTFSNNVLREFTQSASHDLKEPIRKMQIFAGRLKEKLDGTIGAEEADLLERLYKSAGRMGVLVDDLLSYAQFTQPTEAAEEVDLNVCVNMVLHDLELLLTEKKAEIIVGNLPNIKGTSMQVQQLFQNLLTNSLRYSKPGIQPLISITATRTIGQESGFSVKEEDEQRYFSCITVQDNGIGFDSANAEKIFNVFTRLHRQNEYPGSGVGLAIVRRVIDNHHGYIRAKSQPGEGATFTILWPE